MANHPVVVITGGAGGIGREVGSAFVAQGAQVILVDHNERSLRDAANEIGAQCMVLDLTDAQRVQQLIAEIDDQYQGIDVLVNNAGLLSIHGSVMELEVESYRQILDVNVLGTFAVTQAVAKVMQARGRGGAIVNISSIGARQPTFGMGGYESSKAAVDSLTRWSSLELAEHGIRVNAVAPGPVLTPMLAGAMPEGSPAREAWQSRIPLKQLADPSDVVQAVLFLAAPAARHITGVSLPVDGGQLLT